MNESLVMTKLVMFVDVIIEMLALLTGSVFIAALINHVMVCIACENWILLISGIILFPIGIVHGIGNWFGYFNVCG